MFLGETREAKVDMLGRGDLSALLPLQRPWEKGRKNRCSTWRRGIYQIPSSMFRSFEKGLADRGGWREETLHMPEIQASFLCTFSYAPLGEGGHIAGELS